MDTYQPIYDAVRSRMNNCDVGRAVESAMREANLSHYAEMSMRSAQDAASECIRPSVLMRPRISIDGDMWCALYGDNLQDGVAGFGESPYLAMCAFDQAWLTKLGPGKAAIASSSPPQRIERPSDDQARIAKNLESGDPR